jgi:hypothetical protein
MKLAAYRRNPDGGSHLHFIRDVSEEEYGTFKDHIKLFVDARERFRLLQMLQRNFDELQKSITSGCNDMIELDRLLTNYLSLGYVLTTHFETYVKQTFGRDSAECHKIEELTKELREQSAAFRFFFGARHCVTHCSFLIHKGNVKQTKSGFETQLVSKLAQLRKFDTRGEWGLPTDIEEIELVPLLVEYHNILTCKYAVRLIETFRNNLFIIAKFFSSFTEEIHKHDKSSVGVFIPDSKPVGDRLNLSLEFIPADPLGELGLRLTFGSSSEQIPS